MNKSLNWSKLFRHCLLPVTMLLVSCTKVTPTSIENPDGVDPPEKNPYPQQFVSIYVVAPKTLTIHIAEDWYAPTFPARVCVKDWSKPVDPRDKGHQKEIPVTLRWNGSQFEGTFNKDRFLPGRCAWGFTGISTELPSLDTTVIYSNSISNSPFVSHAIDQNADIWCGIDPAPKGSHKMICTDLEYFAKYSKEVPQKLLDTNRHSILPSSIVFIDDKTRSVNLHYHDLAAEINSIDEVNSVDVTASK